MREIIQLPDEMTLAVAQDIRLFSATFSVEEAEPARRKW
jgi:hypothetical protein